MTGKYILSMPRIYKKGNEIKDNLELVQVMAKWAARHYGGRTHEWIGLAWIARSEAELTFMAGGLSLQNWAWWRFKDLIHLELAIPKKSKREGNYSDDSTD